MKIYHLKGFCADLFEQGTYPLAEVFATLEEAKARMEVIRDELVEAFKDVAGEEYDYMSVNETTTYNNPCTVANLEIHLTANPNIDKQKETLLQFGMMLTTDYLHNELDVNLTQHSITYRIASLSIIIEELNLSTDESK